jgi:hypothetical protein
MCYGGEGEEEGKDAGYIDFFFLGLVMSFVNFTATFRNKPQ